MKNIEDLNGFEMKKARQMLGGRVDQADPIELLYVLTFLFQKRDDSGIEYNTVLGMSLREVQEYLGVEDDDEADPFATDPKE